MRIKRSIATIKRITLGFLIIILILSGAFLVWSLNPLSPMPEAIASSQNIAEGAADNWLVFQPAGAQPETGLIFYPGGRVDYRAYAPLAQAIADGGYLVVIVPMRLNLAVFSPDRAAQVIDAYPQVRRWVTAGHSLGGSMAARYAARNPDQVSGLILLASYPIESDSLAGLETRALSIYATLDGLATPADIDAARAFLPLDARYLAIEGGNHAQFGWYGVQDGDGQASISRAEQQARTVDAILEFLEALEED